MDYFVVFGEGDPIGPVPDDLIVRGIEAGRIPPGAFVVEVGRAEWVPLVTVVDFAKAVRRATPPAPPRPPARAGDAWYAQRPDDERAFGPFAEDDLARALVSGQVAPDVLVCRVGDTKWAPATSVPAFRRATDDAREHTHGFRISDLRRPADEAAIAETEYYVTIDGAAALGPHASTAITEACRCGALPSHAQVCPVGGSTWTPLSSVPAFAAALPSVGAPVASQAPAVQETGIAPNGAHQGPATAAAPSAASASRPAVDNFPVAHETWMRQFEEAAVASPVFGRPELERAVRAALATFKMAPSDFARAAKLALHWTWFPVIVARAHFESEWSGTAVPYVYVERQDEHGRSHREKRRQAPRSFSGSLPSRSYTLFVPGRPDLVPVQLLLAANSVVDGSAPVVPLASLSGESLGGLAESAGCTELNVSLGAATDMLSQHAHSCEQALAESDLRSLTSGDWEDRRARVSVSHDEPTFVLVLVPALVGTYSYRSRTWRAIALASNGYAGCEGAPTSAVKVLGIALAVAGLVVAALYWLDIGPFRSWFGQRAAPEVPGLTAEAPAAPIESASATVEAPAPTSWCGSANHPPRTARATGDWRSHACMTRAEAGARWSQCLRRSEYADDEGKGCPGESRCCPPVGAADDAGRRAPPSPPRPAARPAPAVPVPAGASPDAPELCECGKPRSPRVSCAVVCAVKDDDDGW